MAGRGDYKGFSIQGSANDSKDTCRSEPSTSYEVFRNKTTAVEVVVKDIHKSKKYTQCNIHAEIEKLKSELEAANQTILNTKRSFQTIVHEMGKQIETASAREADSQSKNLSLKLENEKLRILLDTKTKLIGKLKKELVSLKRVLKFVIRSIYKSPEAMEPWPVSDPEYEDFEAEMKNTRAPYGDNTQNATDTFDSSILSKQSYFDKKL